MVAVLPLPGSGALGDQTLSNAVPVVLDDRYKSCHRGLALENLNLTAAADFADVT